MQKSDSKTLALKLFGGLALGLALTACGGNDSSRLEGFDPGDAPGEGDGGGVVDGGPAQLGRGTGADFVAGEIALGIGAGASLSPGGRTALDVSLVDSFGELITSPVSVSFNSDCIATGASNLIDTDEEGGSSVETSNGTATVTYQANGCVGEDPITARATYEGVNVDSARAIIVVEADTIQTLSFVGAEPEDISIKGTGGNETSTVTFRVLGTTGSPVRDAEVTFSLTPAGTGGLALVNSNDRSNANGEVTTTVQAGTVPTTVRVTASTPTDVGTISTQSNQLVVSTGIPDQNSTSLSASDLYPVSWNYDGIESTLSIRLADAFANPAPDGTAVTFTTSGGAVDSSCTTTGGACSVTWRSQNPRPEPSQGFIVSESPLGVFCPDGLPANQTTNCRPGRVKVLATALGNESFEDLNSNGVYDQDDIFLDDNSNGQCDANRPESYSDVDDAGCDDLGTAYLDRDFSGTYDSDEVIVALSPDEDSAGSEYQSGNGKYNGVLCSEASREAGECDRASITVRDDIMIVMTSAQPYFMPDGRLPGQEDVVLAPGESATVTMLLADMNGNGMPAGTTLSLNDELASNVEAAIFPDGALSGSAEPGTISVTITADDNADNPAGGVLFIRITAPTPNGELISSPTAIGISAPPPPPDPEV